MLEDIRHAEELSRNSLLPTRPVSSRWVSIHDRMGRFGGFSPVDGVYPPQDYRVQDLDQLQTINEGPEQVTGRPQLVFAIPGG